MVVDLVNIEFYYKMSMFSKTARTQSEDLCLIYCRVQKKIISPEASFAGTACKCVSLVITIFIFLRALSAGWLKGVLAHIIK